MESPQQAVPEEMESPLTSKSAQQTRPLPPPPPCCASPQDLSHKIVVPRSVPSMVTDRLLVMTFLEGIPITRLGDHTQK